MTGHEERQLLDSTFDGSGYQIEALEADRDELIAALRLTLPEVIGHNKMDCTDAKPCRVCGIRKQVRTLLDRHARKT